MRSIRLIYPAARRAVQRLLNTASGYRNAAGGKARGGLPT